MRGGGSAEGRVVSVLVDGDGGCAGWLCSGGW